MKTCRVCGTECNDGEKFCQNCGAEFYSEPTTSNNTQQTYQQAQNNQQQGYQQNQYNQQQGYQQNQYNQQQGYQQNQYNQQQGYQQNPYNQQQGYQQNPYAQYNKMNQNTYQSPQFDMNWANDQAILNKANASKVLGIIAFFINPLFILSILAITMGNSAMKMASPQNLAAQSSAKIGKTCGIVSLIINAAILIIYIALLVVFAADGTLSSYDI